MNIKEIKVMRGPNYWSNYRQKLIVLKLDIESLEERPTNMIEGFAERISELIPSLYSHHCSEEEPGGFFKRVQMGTWMGHVIEHIALELQTLAGMECGYGRTRGTGKHGEYYVLFSYIHEKAGLYAAKAAVRIAAALVDGRQYNIEEDIEALKSIKRREDFGPSTQAIVDEAIKRNIPYKRIEDSFVIFGYGVNQKKIRATISGKTSALGVEIAGNKNGTKRLLEKAHMPVAPSSLAWDAETLEEAIEEIGFPLVIKPLDGNHGRGVTTNIRNHEHAKEAFALAQNISDTVIVERFVCGNDYRFLLVNYKLVAVAKRTPAFIVGDGKSTVSELIEQTNQDPNRGEGHEKVLTKIELDKASEMILENKGLTPESILPIGEILYLKNTANLSTGGTSRDVTHLVHPANVAMAERVARIVDLDICGIDIVANDVNVPITNLNGAILEVNAAPGFRMHLAPYKGLARNVAEPVMDMLYPKGSPARIPILAVTGTNGKTTSTRLLAHMAKKAGFKPGYTTTDGIYINEHMIHSGDCTGPVSAEAVLLDPTVDMAVLECARGGILRAGLGFDHCDISIITNISDDHLGLKDINTLEEMAQVKAVVARSTFDHGTCILNADDDLVYDLKHELDCNIGLFSMHPDNERIKKHCEEGGYAAIVENGYITVCQGQWKTRIEKLTDVPLCFAGRAECMVKNVLGCVLAGVIQGFEISRIKEALKTFIPSPQFTPGRLNLFEFNNFRILIDYAHNPGGMTELKTFMSQTAASYKVGIITAVGDRRDEDIRNVGALCADIFNEIIIRLDSDLRGRSADSIVGLLSEGISSRNPATPVQVIPNEIEAIRHAMDNARNGSLITILTDKVHETIDFVTRSQAAEKDTSMKFTVPVQPQPGNILNKAV